MEKLDVRNLINGAKTYPTWTTNSTYFLKSCEKNNCINVFYKTKNNRIISKIFPKEINLTPKLIYVLGFLKGEGPSSLGKSNYRRFTITNSNPKIINLALEELDNSKLYRKSDLKDKSIHLLHHTESDKKVISYWAKNLKLSKSKFKCFNAERKTSPFGVCHIYISDVLLRRIIDLIHDKFF